MYLTKDLHTRCDELGINESGKTKLITSSKKFNTFIESYERKLKKEKRYETELEELEK